MNKKTHVKQYAKLCVYVPESYLEAVKSALFNAGAGRLGNYSDCCWQTKGQGQFRPLEGSQPFIGNQQQLEPVDEYKVEMIFSLADKKAILAALRKAHPYETPAFQYWQVELE